MSLFISIRPFSCRISFKTCVVPEGLATVMELCALCVVSVVVRSVNHSQQSGRHILLHICIQAHCVIYLYTGTCSVQVFFTEYCLFYRALLQKRPIIQYTGTCSVCRHGFARALCVVAAFVHSAWWRLT